MTDRSGRFPLFHRPFYDGCSSNYFLEYKEQNSRIGLSYATGIALSASL